MSKICLFASAVSCLELSQKRLQLFSFKVCNWFERFHPQGKSDFEEKLICKLKKLHWAYGVKIQYKIIGTKICIKSVTKSNRQVV